MEPSFFRKIRKAFAALLAAAATGAAIPAYASAFTVTSATSGQTTTFTVTRSGDTSVAETVAYRAVSRSALAGLHFRETAGRLAFAAGQTSLQVSVEERTAAQIDDPRFTYFQSGGATGASRAYRFEVVDEGGFPVAAADRSIDYGSSNSVSSAAFAANALAVSSGEITVTDGGYAQAYHAVPLSSYFSSAVPQNYLAASGARIRMTLDFQAKELSDGYQYVQILADQTSACDSGAGDGDPGTLRASSYLAGFELWKGNTLAEYATLSFPVTSAGNNCGAVSTPWKTPDTTISATSASSASPPAAAPPTAASRSPPRSPRSASASTPPAAATTTGSPSPSSPASRPSPPAPRSSRAAPSSPPHPSARAPPSPSRSSSARS